MTITVNAIKLDMNIGCRTFISMSNLLELLKVGNLPDSIELNGQPIGRLGYKSTSVKEGDKLAFIASPVTNKEKR
jgi:sulfur carrier protein ThiS